jgi:DNA topoisomerase-1
MDGGVTFDEKNHINGIYRKNISTDKNKPYEFKYYYIKNDKIISNKDLERIKKLRIPPMWNSVWVSIDLNSHIQVVGVDTKERKQYLYHQKHIKEAEENKFLRLYKFIKNIPKLEEFMDEHSKLNPYDKNRVISTMLKIVKLLHFRVGKEIYAKQNKSYGISSLKKKHIKIVNENIIFDFLGKSKQKLHYTLNDPDIRVHMLLLKKLDGEKMFQYIDENSKVHKVTDIDLNHYIQKYMGKHFTVKDFRTYGANYHFVKFLVDETKKRDPLNEKLIKKNIRNAIKNTAFYLRHTKNVSKKSYIFNFIVDFYFHNPAYFMHRKNKNINKLLLELMRKFKKSKS